MRLASGFCVCVVTCLLLVTPATSKEGGSQETQVGPDVRAGLETQATVRVVVALELPDRPQALAPGASPAERGAFVQELSSAVELD